MSYNTGICLKNKKTVRKILISLFISILFISAFSVIAFAQETQPVDIDKEEVKYVSSEQVYQVFGGYFTMFESIPDGKTIAKSDLLESLNTSKVPTRIILDLEINSEELISEDDLIMYLEEIEKEHEKKDFENNMVFFLAVLGLIIIGAAVIIIFNFKSYKSELRDIENAIRSKGTK